MMSFVIPESSWFSSFSALTGHCILVGVPLHEHQLAIVGLIGCVLDLGPGHVEAAGMEILQRADDPPIHIFIDMVAHLKALHELAEDEHGGHHVGGREVGRRDGEPTRVFGGRGRRVSGKCPDAVAVWSAPGRVRRRGARRLDDVGCAARAGDTSGLKEEEK
jgi:hypothetical protein